MSRVYNFSAGPSVLPLQVLEDVGVRSWGKSGMTVMEMSHRGKNFTKIFEETKGLFRELLNLTDAEDILFTSSGASFNFASIPLSFVGPTVPAPATFADYIVSGSWSARAAAEATIFGPVRIWDLKNADGKYTTLPHDLSWIEKCDTGSHYLHYCDNETVMGIEFPEPPQSNKPLVSDSSSNFLTRAIDMQKHGLVYAGVQKNVAPAAMACVIISKPFLEKANVAPCCPTLMNLPLMLKHDSLYNTPNVWSIYIAGQVAAWVKKQGGVPAMEEAAEKRSQMLYEFIDGSGGYYSNPVEKHARSRMNVPFRVGFANSALEEKFVKNAEAFGLVELKGHRSVGGCRASMYNAMPMHGVEMLLEFMKGFMESNPV